MRIFCVSDLHTDCPENLRWCENLEREPDSALIVAGDVATDLGQLRRCFAVLQARYDVVYYTPGNHELWRSRGFDDSLKKLFAVLRLCDEVGVRTRPELLPCGCFVVPLLSWPHEDWDREPPLQLPPGESYARPIAPVERCISDYGACAWPAGYPRNGSRALSELFDAMNDLAALLAVRRAAFPSVPLISFSHFLPRQALLPEKRFLFQPNLAKAVGSDFVERRVRELDSTIHVFGHTHFSWDAALDGVRYVQHCLGTPDEAKRREVFMDGIWSGHPKPLLLWDSERPVPRREHAPYWSAFYAANERDPTSYHMAEYVRRVYCPNAPAAAMPLPRGADAAARGDSDASLQRRLVRLAGASRA